MEDRGNVRGCEGALCGGGRWLDCAIGVHAGTKTYGIAQPLLPIRFGDAAVQNVFAPEEG